MKNEHFFNVYNIFIQANHVQQKANVPCRFMKIYRYWNVIEPIVELSILVQVYYFICRDVIRSVVPQAGIKNMDK